MLPLHVLSSSSVGVSEGAYLPGVPVSVQTRFPRPVADLPETDKLLYLGGGGALIRAQLEPGYNLTETRPTSSPPQCWHGLSYHLTRLHQGWHPPTPPLPPPTRPAAFCCAPGTASCEWTLSAPLPRCTALQPGRGCLAPRFQPPPCHIYGEPQEWVPARMWGEVMRIASSLHKNFPSIGLFVFFSLLLAAYPHLWVSACLGVWMTGGREPLAPSQSPNCVS